MIGISEFLRSITLKARNKMLPVPVKNADRVLGSFGDNIVSEDASEAKGFTDIPLQEMSEARPGKVMPDSRRSNRYNPTDNAAKEGISP